MAQSRQATYFGTDDATWKAMQDADMGDTLQEANMIFLQRQIDRSPGEIILTHDPKDWIMSDTAYGGELQLLDRNGYQFRPRTDGLWEAYKK